jgi:hypothetical protein
MLQKAIFILLAVTSAALGAVTPTATPTRTPTPSPTVCTGPVNLGGEYATGGPVLSDALAFGNWFNFPDPCAVETTSTAQAHSGSGSLYLQDVSCSGTGAYWIQNVCGMSNACSYQFCVWIKSSGAVAGSNIFISLEPKNAAGANTGTIVQRYDITTANGAWTPFCLTITAANLGASFDHLRMVLGDDGGSVHEQVWFDDVSLLGLGACVPSATPSSTISPTFSATPSNSPNPTATPTWSPSITDTFSQTLTPSPTLSWSPSVTNTFSQTLTPSPTLSWSPSVTNTFSQTLTPSPTLSWSPSVTNTFSQTLTPSPTLSWSPSVTNTFSQTLTPSPTLSWSPSVSRTFSQTRTPSPSLTWSPSLTRSATPANTASPTTTLTPSPFVTAGPSATRSPMPATWSLSLRVTDASGGTVALRSLGSAASAPGWLELSADPWDPAKGPLLLSCGAWSASFDGLDSSGSFLSNGTYVLELNSEDAGRAARAVKSVTVLRSKLPFVAGFAWPNPVPRGSQALQFTWSPAGQDVEASIYGVSGERVDSLGSLKGGKGSWILNQRANGIYFLALRVPGERQPRLLKVALAR